MTEALSAFANWLHETESSTALRESQYVMPWVYVVHVISMAMFAGTILMMDLRLLGIANMQTPFSQVQRRLFPWQMLGMAVSAITGVVLVYGSPLNYYANIIFWTKMFSMALAGLNALAFHFITEYTLVDWDTDAVLPVSAKLAGAVSLVLWVNVIVAGRLMYYATTWFRA